MDATKVLPRLPGLESLENERSRIRYGHHHHTLGLYEDHHHAFHEDLDPYAHHGYPQDSLGRMPDATALPLTASISTGSSATSTASLDLKRDSPEQRGGRMRTRTDSSVTRRLSICSTSGTVYESVVVVGHVYGSDNVVYYLLEVKSWEAPLDGYVIRRRYNDFKQLHRELALCMPQTGGIRRGSSPAVIGTGASGTRTFQAPPPPPRRNTTHHRDRDQHFGLASSSLLCTSLSTARPERSPLWSPRRRENDLRRHSSMRLPRGDTASVRSETAMSSRSDPFGSREARYSSTTSHHHQQLQPPWENDYSEFVDLPFHTVSYDRDGRPVLPSMPPGGVSSFFTSREQLIKYRVEKFNRILAAVLSDTSTRVALVLMNFIQDKPSAPQSYVSLNQYAPVEMPWSVERYARRRATTSLKSGTSNKSRDRTPVHHPFAEAG